MQQLISQLMMIVFAFLIGLLFCGKNTLALANSQVLATEIFHSGTQKL